MRTDQEGRRTHRRRVSPKGFCRSACRRSRARHGRASERDIDRIHSQIAGESRSSAALAIFACSAKDDFFEAIQLDAPIDRHQLFIQSTPHLYPLARVNDQSPRYAALGDGITNSARLYVFDLGTEQTRQQITKPEDTSALDGRAGRRRGISVTSRTSICYTRRKSLPSSIDYVLRRAHQPDRGVVRRPSRRPVLMETPPAASRRKSHRRAAQCVRHPIIRS
jgi:hypothetical protein